MRTDVLNRIKETLRKVIPAGGHAFLYGSQARNEARPDSDWLHGQQSLPSDGARGCGSVAK